MKKNYYIVLILMTCLVACEENGKLPTVLTGQYTVFSESKTVQVEGYVETDGGSAVVDRGICYVEGYGSPTVASNRVSAGSGRGSFSAILTAIENGTYTMRAFATNATGTAYGDEVTFTMQNAGSGGSGGGSGGGGGGSGSLTINDFIGTYSVSAYNWDSNQSETWSNVKIASYEDNNFSNAVMVEGLLWGGDYTYFTAIGQFDATKQCIRLFSGWHFTSRTFAFTSDESVNYYASFYPVYTTKSLTSFSYINDGAGYDGCGEAWLTFNSAGKLKLGGSNTADSNGNYATGFVFRYFNASTDKYSGRFNVFIDVVLTKTSSNAAPAKKMPSDKRILSPNRDEEKSLLGKKEKSLIRIE